MRLVYTMRLPVLIIVLITLAGCGNFVVTTQSTVCPETLTSSGSLVTLHAFGDSITAGTGATNGNGYIYQLTSSLSLNLDQHALGGTPFTHECQYGAMSKFSSPKNDVTTLLIGFNDVSFYGVSELQSGVFQQELTQALIQVTNQGGKVFLGTTLYAPVNSPFPNHSNENVNAFVTTEKQIITTLREKGYPVHLVDTNAVYDPTTMVSNDNLHPNDLGHKVIAQAFYNAITGVK